MCRGPAGGQSQAGHPRQPSGRSQIGAVGQQGIDQRSTPMAWRRMDHHAAGLFTTIRTWSSYTMTSGIASATGSTASGCGTYAATRSPSLTL